MSAADFPTPSHFSPKAGDPTWDLALHYPLQGHWTVREYLSLDTGMLVEFTDGYVRVLPMPSILHQLIVQYLFKHLDQFVGELSLGKVLFAPLPIRLSAAKYREPDIAVITHEQLSTADDYPWGAELVVEVVSAGKESRHRDYVEKRYDYAEAGVKEYWIVDPEDKRVTVLTLSDEGYAEHGVFSPNELATSRLLAGFAIDVDDLFSRS